MIYKNRPAHVLRDWGLLLSILSGLTVFFSACKKQEETAPALSTISQLISNGSRFTILKAALTKAGMDATLNQAGTFTLFAPTDDAFKAFGYADVAAINAAPAELLKSVLQYHVLSTRIGAANIQAGLNNPQQTMANAPVYISKVTLTSGTSTSATSSSATTISVNGARIVQADGAATNGVVHAIDRILLPPIFGDVVKTIQGIPTLVPSASFKLLQAAVTRVGSATTLASANTITVFAPTDAAFRAAGYDSTAIAKAPVATLNSVLGYHVLTSRTYTPLITNGSSLTTLQGGTITATSSATAVTLTGKGNGTSAANVTFPDITATNGVVHIIDRLLLPQ
ncbi:fasciclin domain-containing protein [Spirosoma flavus]